MPKHAYFFSSHLDGMKRLLGSGAADRGMISLSSLNQFTSGSYGLICRQPNTVSTGAQLITANIWKIAKDSNDLVCLKLTASCEARVCARFLCMPVLL